MGRTSPVVEKPAINSVLLGGRYVSVQAISRVQGLDPSYVCKIINGKKDPTVKTARKIASAVGMGLEEFLDAVDERVKHLKAAEAKMVGEYKHRVRKEQMVDYIHGKRGRLVTKRMPGLKLGEVKKVTVDESES